MTEMQCPPDEDLVPLLSGDTLSESLRSHLDSCDPCRRRLELLRSELAELRSLTPPTAVGPTARSRPAQIGKYLVVGSLDSGGQAHVYRALHPTLDKELVIKLSRTPVDEDSEQRHLLVAEGKLLASLEHPNLARVYDLDFHEDLPFLAMEYVRGRTLTRFAADDRPAPREASRMVAEVARALAAVHRRGVIHQDLKPANILVDEDDRPRLIDFGLARLRHAWDDGGGPPTGGTPAFMAPEQARDQSERVGSHSDIFALGGVLYYVLTGAAPFDAGSPRESLARAARCDFDRAALRRADIPRRLERVVLKAMAERPEDRYARADELAVDLEAFAAGFRWPAWAARAAAAVVLLAVSAWAVAHLMPGPAAAFTPELAIQVTRHGQPLELAQAVPLDRETDRVQIIAKVPPGAVAALYYVNGLGRVEKLNPDTSPAGAFSRLVFPGGGQAAPLDPGSAGTDFVLLVTAASEDQLRDLELLLASEVGTLPALPGRVYVRLNRDEPSRQVTHLGPGQPDPVATVEHRLDRLRRRLIDERKLGVVLGVAFGH